MGGTGLEPVPPACRYGAAVRASSLRCAQTATLTAIQPATERVSAPERPLILAILATRDAAREMAIAARVLKDELRIDQCAPVACALFEALLGHGRGLSPGE